MDFIAEVDARLLEAIENRSPALAQFGKTLLDQTARTLWPWVDVGPQQRAGEGRVGFQSQALAGAGGQFQLVDGPFGPCLGLAAQVRGGEVIEQGIERRMHGHQLALQVSRQLTDLDACLGADGFQLVAVTLTFRGAGQVDVLRAQGG
ncbi:hypothetical protein D3C85_1443100 [compost metagenome]